MGHRDGGIDGHHVRFALHAGDGREPLAQRLRALDLWVVLAGLPSDPRAPERICAKHVATAAGPEQIVLGGVSFLAVNVPHFNGARTSTKTAASFARRRAGVRPVAQSPVS